MHPAFWPMQAFVFWADVLMLPWTMIASHRAFVTIASAPHLP